MQVLVIQLIIRIENTVHLLSQISHHDIKYNINTTVSKVNSSSKSSHETFCLLFREQSKLPELCLKFKDTHLALGLGSL